MAAELCAYTVGTLTGWTARCERLPALVTKSGGALIRVMAGRAKHSVSPLAAPITVCPWVARSLPVVNPYVNAKGSMIQEIFHGCLSMDSGRK